MAAIQDLVLTFCPKMHSVQLRKLELLMPVLRNCEGCATLQNSRKRSQMAVEPPLWPNRRSVKQVSVVLDIARQPLSSHLYKKQTILMVTM